jgi:hypothetical protein
MIGTSGIYGENYQKNLTKLSKVRTANPSVVIIRERERERGGRSTASSREEEGKEH